MEEDTRHLPSSLWTPHMYTDREREKESFQTKGDKRDLITNGTLIRMDSPGTTGEIQLWINVLTSPGET